VVGHELRDVELPEATSVAVMIREGRAIVPRAETRLRDGDKLLVITSAEREDELRNLLIGA
jgi:trk system potassium uptake protein TrkA